MKVYVTGMGAVTSIGSKVESMFSNLLANRTGVKAFPQWEQHKGLHSMLAAPATEYDISRIPRTARRTMSRMSEMATVATAEALQQSDLKIGQQLKTPRVLMIMGSTAASPEILESYFKKIIERNGPEGQMGTTFFKVMNHTVVANVAAAIGFHGPTLAVSSACTTSAQAMILGWEMIKSGSYDVAICGGADDLNYLSTAVFDIVLAASRGYNDRPELASRPFDSKRDGLVVSEGAAVVILESEEHLRSRNGKPLAEMSGGTYHCNGSHMSHSDAGTMVEVMKSSLARAKLKADDIGYVNAHATATVHGDPEEAQAVAQVFGNSTPVSSLKGHFGHSLAACGALEAIASIKMMEKGVVIQTRNLESVDPSCAGPLHVLETRTQPLQHVLSNNFAFGGMNTSLVLSKIL